jgi:RecA-family ATPase
MGCRGRRDGKLNPLSGGMNYESHTLQQDVPDLSWLNFEDVKDLPDKEPPIVIEGLLRITEKLGITAGSKSFKTWLLLYIGYCIANGLDFLGHKTHRAKVVVFDLELSKNGLKRRLTRIQQTLGQGDYDNIKVCSLRGKARLFCKNFESIKARVVQEGFKVVIIDPVYKFLLGRDESSNGLVADMLENLTMFCMEAQVALLYIRHHSKGNQAGRIRSIAAAGPEPGVVTPTPSWMSPNTRIAPSRSRSIPVP